MSFVELEQLVISWGKDKDLIKRENADKQFMKFIEEVFEFRDELTKISYRADLEKQLRGQGFTVHVDESFIKSLKLEMGDILVTLIILSAQLDIDLTECLEMAYEKISKRKDNIFHEVVHINLGDIDDEKLFIKEYDFDDFYDRAVNSWEAELSDETITKMYEGQKWTKVLMFTLND